MKKLIIFSFLLAFAGTVFGQASLALISDGKTVGWLLSKGGGNRGGVSFQYLTPEGYIIILNPFGFIMGTTQVDYESEDCTGQAFSSNVFHGEVWQVGAFSSAVFVRMEQTAQLERRLIYSQNRGNGCEPRKSDPPADVFPVTQVDPATYGIKNVGDNWLIPIDSLEVQRPDGIFCNGFESCPN